MAKKSKTRKTKYNRRNPAAALLDGMRRLARMSADERAALGEFCRRTAREHYDINRTAADTAAVLSDTAREARPGILICGYYGAGNAGDDASLAAVAGRLAAHDPTARLTATVRGRRGGIPAGDAEIRLVGRALGERLGVAVTTAEAAGAAVGARQALADGGGAHDFLDGEKDRRKREEHGAQYRDGGKDEYGNQNFHRFVPFNTNTD